MTTAPKPMIEHAQLQNAIRGQEEANRRRDQGLIERARVNGSSVDVYEGLSAALREIERYREIIQVYSSQNQLLWDLHQAALEQIRRYREVFKVCSSNNPYQSGQGVNHGNELHGLREAAVPGEQAGLRDKDQEGK